MGNQKTVLTCNPNCLQGESAKQQGWQAAEPSGERRGNSQDVGAGFSPDVAFRSSDVLSSNSLGLTPRPGCKAIGFQAVCDTSPGTTAVWPHLSRHECCRWWRSCEGAAELPIGSPALFRRQDHNWPRIPLLLPCENVSLPAAPQRTRLQGKHRW